MYRQNKALVELLSPVVESMDYELLGLEYHEGDRRAVLRVYIDSAQGIGVDDCAQVSQRLSTLLDVHDPVPSSYQLEVSSPGTDRPLFTLAQFARCVGSRARVRLQDRSADRHTFTGRIAGVEDDMVQIETADGLHVLLAEHIAWARLVPEYRSAG